MTTKHDDLKPIGYSKSSSKRGFYINSVSPEKARKISNNLDLYPMTLAKKKKKRKKENPELVEGKHKDQIRSKRNINEENNSKDQ